jgi:hypothetical protein
LRLTPPTTPSVFSQAQVDPVSLGHADQSISRDCQRVLSYRSWADASITRVSVYRTVVGVSHTTTSRPAHAKAKTIQTIETMGEHSAMPVRGATWNDG